mgnify:CR=1 FL=1
MRNIYEKLRHFDEVILKDAAAERDKILQQIEADSQERIARERKKLEEQARQLLEKETVQAEVEKNNIISKAIINSRQLMVKKREEIVSSVYDETKRLLEDFVKKDDEYLPYFLKSINNALGVAGGNDSVVYLTASDMQRFARQLEQLKKELPFQVTFEQAGDDIIGGCKVYNKTTDTVADETLAGRLESNKEKILEICDLKI